jgi:hypothetical protein
VNGVESDVRPYPLVLTSALYSAANCDRTGLVAGVDWDPDERIVARRNEQRADALLVVLILIANAGADQASSA